MKTAVQELASEVLAGDRAGLDPAKVIPSPVGAGPISPGNLASPSSSVAESVAAAAGHVPAICEQVKR